MGKKKAKKQQHQHQQQHPQQQHQQQQQRPESRRGGRAPSVTSSPTAEAQCHDSQQRCAPKLELASSSCEYLSTQAGDVAGSSSGGGGKYTATTSTTSCGGGGDFEFDELFLRSSSCSSLVVTTLDASLESPAVQQRTPELRCETAASTREEPPPQSSTGSEERCNSSSSIASSTEEDEEETVTVERDQSGDFQVNLDDSLSRVDHTHFELLKLVGEGAYGKVYQVRKRECGAIYAVKVFSKRFLINTDNVVYTRRERDIIRRVRHPFIVSLHFAYQTADKVYLVMDFVNGGQLFFHLRKEAMFEEALARFYVAELVLVLEHLHARHVIHRDLKPENILLDSDGHLVVTDFGFAKDNFDDGSRTSTFCGTYEYMAPEIFKGTGYGKAADWWSVGILMYDMLTGAPPFQHKHRQKLQEKILNERLRFPKYLSSNAVSLVKKLLERNPEKRLGGGKKGTSLHVAAVKAHPFFQGINWKKLYLKEVIPPFRPCVRKGKIDTSNFMPIANCPTGSPHHDELSASQQELFKGFSYVRSPSPHSIAHLERTSLERISLERTSFDAPIALERSDP